MKHKLSYLADKYLFGMICLQEHRILLNEKLLSETLFKYTSVTSSVTKKISSPTKSDGLL